MDAFDLDGFAIRGSADAPTISCQKSYKNNTRKFTTFPRHQSPSLHQETLATLKSFFGARGHRPSLEMWTALEELASVLEAMAEGRCPPTMFLSSLDPGVGKTQTVVQFVRALIRSEAHQDVGVLLCMSRLEEIRSVVNEMALSPSDFAILTADQSLNGLGNCRVNEARVLFTTQQMIEKRGEGRRFAEMEDFHFLGQPRQVRIWDESILPGRTLTLNRDAMAALLQPLRATHSRLAETIEDMFFAIRGVEDGGVYQLPDLAAESGVELNELLQVIARIPSDPRRLEHEQAITELWLLAGKTVAVRRDGAYGNTVLSYQETLPDGLTPLVVLDASGRVRGTYRQWETNRGGLTPLSSAPKRYNNLTIHCWETGGGKSAFKQNRRTLLDGIASTINTKPDEEWLVVFHKDGIGMDFEAEVRGLIAHDKGRVHFLNWGNHHATNNYSGVRNVILAGTLFYRPSYYEALARLAANKRPGVSFAPTELEEVIIGEHRHLVLQALCRGSVRRCQGDVCARCDAYIIAATRSGIPETLPKIFPGCRIVRWQPVQKALRGKVKEAAEFVLHWFEKNPEGLLRFNIVQRAIGMDNAANFTNNVRQHPDFMEALANQGIAEARMLGDRRRGFLRPRFVEAPSVE
jgi:hypothetical protein